MAYGRPAGENVAKLAGKLPAGVTRSLEAAEAARVDWRELLRRAWSETIPADYSWTRPNRRHLWTDSICRGWSARASVRSRLPSTAPAP